MLTLTLSAEPKWVDLGHGVEVLVARIGTSVLMQARTDPDLPEPPAMDDAGIADAADPLTEPYAVAMNRAIARVAILDWKGVVGEDAKPLDVTPEAIDALLEHWVIFQAFQLQVVNPAMVLEQEKNGSAPSPTGGSAGAQPTAKPARRRAKTARKS
ncbi:MAG: hypothetical protein AAFR79_09070 [Pseudomonadota bacterium]